jgi:DNA mismatch repair protein MLH3
LLFDQHAVDERIRVEALTRQLEWELSEGTVPTCAPADPAPLSMTDEEVSALIARSAVVRRWRFDFHIPSGPGVRRAGAEVILRSAPTILGEDLSAADFLEFVRLIAQSGASAPEPLLIPPAAQRILSSKACRGAVKFGDALAQELCAGMLDRLFRETQLPFQCAHGRPTVSSIFKMDSVRAWKMRAFAADSL